MYSRAEIDEVMLSLWDRLLDSENSGRGIRKFDGMICLLSANVTVGIDCAVESRDWLIILLGAARESTVV